MLQSVQQVSQPHTTSSSALNYEVETESIEDSSEQRESFSNHEDLESSSTSDDQTDSCSDEDMGFPINDYEPESDNSFPIDACVSHPEEEFDIDEKMFEPLYDGANITICGAYCALMEFKRACRLPFTTIDKLLELLQLLCPPNNSLPRSTYKFKKFFQQFSSSYQKQLFCSNCLVEFRGDQSKCDNPSC